MMLGFAAVVATLVTLGCSVSKVGNSNSIAASDTRTPNSPAAATSTAAAAPNVLEPERYFVNLTATLENKTASPQSCALSFARLGGDRCWSIQSTQPPFTYLEKSGLKYLVFPTLGEYAEIVPGEAGFQPDELITPNLAWTRLKSRPAEKLGVEPVNGRTAIKYSFRSTTTAAEKSEFLLVDQETGLAIRSELSPAREREPSGTRLTVDARDLQLNPDRRQFEVPVGMKKVTAEQLKPRIRSLVEALRVYSVFY